MIRTEGSDLPAEGRAGPDYPNAQPQHSHRSQGPKRVTSLRVMLRHELTLIVSVYGPKVSVEVPKGAVTPFGLDPAAFALIVTPAVL